VSEQHVNLSFVHVQTQVVHCNLRFVVGFEYLEQQKSVKDALHEVIENSTNDHAFLFIVSAHELEDIVAGVHF